MLASVVAAPFPSGLGCVDGCLPAGSAGGRRGPASGTLTIGRNLSPRLMSARPSWYASSSRSRGPSAPGKAGQLRPGRQSRGGLPLLALLPARVARKDRAPAGRTATEALAGPRPPAGKRRLHATTVARLPRGARSPPRREHRLEGTARSPAGDSSGGLGHPDLLDVGYKCVRAPLQPTPLSQPRACLLPHHGAGCRT